MYFRLSIAVREALAFIILCGAAALLGSCGSRAPEYLPDLSLLALDSVTAFHTGSIAQGQPVLLVYFRPYCKHCRQETEDILDNYKSFEGVQIIFVSADELDKVRQFAGYYNLHLYRNISIAWDNRFDFFKTFKPRAIPYQAVYDSSGKLVKVYNGETKWTELLLSAKGS